MGWEFCQKSESVQFSKIVSILKTSEAFNQDLADFVKMNKFQVFEVIVLHMEDMEEIMVIPAT